MKTDSNIKRTGSVLRCTLILLLGLAASGALAQVRIGLKLEHKAVLQFEPVRAFITIYNDDDVPLTVADDRKDNFEMRFLVEDSNGFPARQISDSPVCRRLMILPGTSQAMMREVTDWRRMIGLKRYTVVVEAVWHGNRYLSNKASVNVVSGLIIAEMKKSLTGYSDRIRCYSLRYWKRERFEHLFLRVDEDVNGLNMNYGVIDLGRVIRVFKPELTVEGDGSLEVFHQSGRRCFTRTYFKSDPDRLRFVDRTYHLPNGDPYPSIRGLEEEGETRESTNAHETVKFEQ